MKKILNYEIQKTKRKDLIEFKTEIQNMSKTKN